MNFLRAVGISVALYAGTFAVALLIGIVFGMTAIAPGRVAGIMWIAGIGLAAGLSCLASIWYFRQTRALATASTGLMFGLCAVVTGFVLDLSIVVISGRGVSEFVEACYSEPLFGITITAVLAATSVTGKLLHAGDEVGQDEASGNQ